MADYLGLPVSNLLATPPFSGWKVKRSTEEDLPKKEIYYEFEGHGVEVICDGDERISTIFLHRGDGEALSELAFLLSRREVLERYGVPSKSGSAVRHPVLGDRGAWDRFTFPTATLHILYQPNRDQIERVSLMRPDVVP